MRFVDTLDTMDYYLDATPRDLIISWGINNLISFYTIYHICSISIEYLDFYFLYKKRRIGFNK